jgi:hypothetical protein
MISGEFQSTGPINLRRTTPLRPWGLTGFQHSEQNHFVTFCCYHRHRPIFITQEYTHPAVIA